jgi:hypothetical protein
MTQGMDDLHIDITRTIDDSVDESELLSFNCDTPHNTRNT